jgi:hypothetical protein
MYFFIIVISLSLNSYASNDQHLADRELLSTLTNRSWWGYGFPTASFEHVKSLLSSGAGANASEPNHQTALGLAITNHKKSKTENTKKIVCHLIAFGADAIKLSIIENESLIPLNYLICRERIDADAYDFIKLMLAHNAKINTKTPGHNLSSMEMALKAYKYKKCSIRLVILFVRHNQNNSEALNSTFEYVIQLGLFDILKLYLHTRLISPENDQKLCDYLNREINIPDLECNLPYNLDALKQAVNEYNQEIPEYERYQKSMAAEIASATQIDLDTMGIIKAYLPQTELDWYCDKTYE